MRGFLISEWQSMGAGCLTATTWRSGQRHIKLINQFAMRENMHMWNNILSTDKNHRDGIPFVSLDSQSGVIG